ncbi:MAG: hypothetical protein WKG07_15980 [Hymenobacter sp.]
MARILTSRSGRRCASGSTQASHADFAAAEAPGAGGRRAAGLTLRPRNGRARPGRWRAGVSFTPTPLAEASAGLPINGLVWMGDAAFMRGQIRQKAGRWLRAACKLKIGGLDFAAELAAAGRNPGRSRCPPS